jgi:hypothetical protein
MRFFIVHTLALTLALAARPAAAEDLYVDATSQPPGDGSQGSPYPTISAAVARARNDRLTMAVPDSETIVVHVRAGEYFGSYVHTGSGNELLPILLDVPNLELRGDTVLVFDADGWPTGAVNGTETSLTATTFLGGGFLERFMFLVGPTSDLLTGADVTIGGFVIDGGLNGQKYNGVGIGLDRAAGASIAGNVIQRTSYAMFARASTAAIRGNFINDCRAGGILTAGPAASPASYLFQDNRSVRNHDVGVTPWATGHVFAWDPALTPVPADALYDANHADVIHNDLSDNTSTAGSTGIRCGMFLPGLPAGQSTGHLTVNIESNRIAGNSIGFYVDAGFPARSYPQSLTASFHGYFAGNQVTASAIVPALITFTDNWTARKQTPSQLSVNKYLEDSLFEFIVDDELAGFWYDNPSSDPGSGVALDNTLLVNGVPFSGRNIP